MIHLFRVFPYSVQRQTRKNSIIERLFTQSLLLKANLSFMSFCLSSNPCFKLKRKLSLVRSTKTLYCYCLLTNYVNFNFVTEYTLLYISNTFMSNTTLKLAKVKQILSSTLRLNYCYLKFFYILRPLII